MAAQTIRNVTLLGRKIALNSSLLKADTIASIRSACVKQKYSRYSANTIMAKKEVLRLNDYDILGFDLDNTLLRYNLPEMVQLEYDVMARYLINKGYSPKYLSKPIADDMDFIQRGLFLDNEKGNILQVAADGVIVKAAHGTKFLSDEQIATIYGETRKWSAINQFIKDPLSTWNGPISEQMRALLDYFDMPACLVFARAIDTIDETHNKPTNYTVWNDLSEAMIQMYSRENFANDKSEYFAAMKRDPSRYILKTNPEVIAWIKEFKKHKATFLLSGSNADFANLTATEALGNNWRELFDIVVCFAKKPGFFNISRPFHEVKNLTEAGLVPANALKLGEIYTQGNWKKLEEVLCKNYNFVIPRSLYIGDNFIQDIYTPSKLTNCDTVAIAEEMLSEGMHESELCHEYGNIIGSKCWGSYFGQLKNPSIWTDIAQKHSRICAPTVDFLAKNSLSDEYECFSSSTTIFSGFFPSTPKSLHKTFYSV